MHFEWKVSWNHPIHKVPNSRTMLFCPIQDHTTDCRINRPIVSSSHLLEWEGLLTVAVFYLVCSLYLKTTIVFTPSTFFNDGSDRSWQSPAKAPWLENKDKWPGVETNFRIYEQPFYFYHSCTVEVNLGSKLSVTFMVLPSAQKNSHRLENVILLIQIFAQECTMDFRYIMQH